MVHQDIELTFVPSECVCVLPYMTSFGVYVARISSGTSVILAEGVWDSAASWRNAASRADMAAVRAASDAEFFPMSSYFESSVLILPE